MKYLESFLAEKTRADNHQAPTDETDKNNSVNFVSDPLALASTCFPAIQPESERNRWPEAYLRAGEVAAWCTAHHIDVAIGAAILDIEDDALALGWPHERLWNPAFWPHSADHPRGLAAVLQPGDTIAEVSPDYITILAQGRHLLRFPKHDG